MKTARRRTWWIGTTRNSLALRVEFGDVAVDEVVRCFRELDAWNPSGRYSVSVPWDPAENQEMAPAQVIDRLAAPRRPSVQERTAAFISGRRAQQAPPPPARLHNRAPKARARRRAARGARSHSGLSERAAGLRQFRLAREPRKDGERLSALPCVPPIRVGQIPVVFMRPLLAYGAQGRRAKGRDVDGGRARVRRAMGGKLINADALLVVRRQLAACWRFAGLQTKTPRARILRLPHAKKGPRRGCSSRSRACGCYCGTSLPSASR